VQGMHAQGLLGHSACTAAAQHAQQPTLALLSVRAAGWLCSHSLQCWQELSGVHLEHSGSSHCGDTVSGWVGWMGGQQGEPWHPGRADERQRQRQWQWQRQAVPPTDLEAITGRVHVVPRLAFGTLAVGSTHGTHPLVALREARGGKGRRRRLRGRTAAVAAAVAAAAGAVLYTALAQGAALSFRLPPLPALPPPLHSAPSTSRGHLGGACKGQGAGDRGAHA